MPNPLSPTLGYTAEEPKADTELRNVRINIMDADTGESVEEVNVLSSADAIQFKDSKRYLPEELAYQLAYTNTNKTPITVGGIEAGTSFVGKNLKKMFDDLLYPYAPPEVNFSSNNKDIFFEEGVNISPITFEVDITKRSEDIKSVALYRSGAKVADLTVNPSGGVIKYTYSSVIDKDCTMNVKVSDKGGAVVTSNILEFRFNKPIYMGVVNTDAEITEVLIKSLHKEVKYDLSFSGLASNEITHQFYPDEQSFFFAAPLNAPLKIYDQNGFNITNSFDKKGIAITNPDGTKSDEYSYYISNKTTQEDFYLTCKILRQS